MIPTIDIAALFDDANQASNPARDQAARDQADRAIAAAATEIGFMLVSGLPASVPVTPAGLQELKRIFALPPDQLRHLWRQKFDPARPNVYRGWFPLQQGHQTYKEGIDMGPDVAHGAAVVDDADPLRETTPLPPEEALPGWRAAIAAYYRGMELTGRVLMRSIARGLGLDERIFDDAFTGGVSTFRLIHYPVRPAGSEPVASGPELWVEHNGERLNLSGAAHVDSGLVTLLAQDGVSGLQARMHDGTQNDGIWVDVPPMANTLVVNFGKLLQRWSGGRIKATEHRVVSYGTERYSIPFFYEPRVDAVIAPLPITAFPSTSTAPTPPVNAASKPAGKSAAKSDFAPFLYGDFVWASTTKFVEFLGMEHLRPPRGNPIS